MPDEPASAHAAPLPALQGIGRRFRPSWRLLRVPFFWVSPAVLAAAFALLCAGVGYPRWLAGAVFMLAAQGALFYGGGVCYVLFFPVHVGRDGIRSHTFWGSPSLLRWDEITSARTWSLLGLAYVLITPRGQWWRTLWAPGLVEDPAAFADTVRQYGGPDAPVARWLETQGR